MEAREKKELRNVVNKAIKVIIFTAIFQALCLGLGSISYLSESYQEEINDFAANNKIILVIGGIYIFSILISSIISYLFYRRDGLTKKLFEKKEKINFLNLLKVSIVVIMLKNIVTVFFDKDAVLPLNDFVGTGISSGSILFLLLVGIIAVVYDEVLYHGYILKSFEKYGGIFSIIIVSVITWCPIFELEQLGGLVVVFIMAYIAYYYSLVYSIILSIMCESVSVIFFTLSHRGIGNNADKIIMIVLVIVSIIIMIQYFKNCGAALIKQIKESNLRLDKFKVALTSILFLAVLVIEFFMRLKDINIPGIGYIILVVIFRYLDK